MTDKRMIQINNQIYCIILILVSVQGIHADEPDMFQSVPMITPPSLPFPTDNYTTPSPLLIDQQQPYYPDITPVEVLSDERAFIKPYQSSSILVRFDSRSDSLPFRIHSPIGARTIRDFSADGIPGLELVAPPEQLTIEEAVQYYQSQPGVIYAEPDYYRFTSRIPADPDFWRQWGLFNSGQTFREGVPSGIPGADIRAHSAWDLATGGDTIVAVLDTGVDYLHPDLEANTWTDPETGATGYDAITGDLEPMDLASHGTHCAGIIGGIGDNNLGITGVNWQTRIIPVRFLNSFGTGTISDEIESILWATRHGARIISCSYGGTTYSRAEYDVMKESDALFICAAGNHGKNTDVERYYPSSLDLPNIIAVTATDAADNLASFSNYGNTTVDLAAPGVEIYSTKHNLYQPEPLWTDPFDSFQNWTPHGNWTLDYSQFVSPDTSAIAYVNQSSDDSHIPAILTLASPLKVSDIGDPVLSYQWSMVGSNYSFMIEGSDNGITWTPLEYGRGTFVIAPFMKRECKIPVDLRGGYLFLRIVADGEFCLLGLDDITLSDGYGDLIEERWGYMDGTSMACPYVSGAVALLASASPDSSLEDVARTILRTTDPLPTLTGKTVTGGKLNLTAALQRITGGSEYHIRLNPGWNHVSVPYRLIPGDDSAEDVFGSLKNVSGHSLYRYESGDWVAVRPQERVSPLTSYWVFTEIQSSLPLMVDPDQSIKLSRDLTTGWNGIGIIEDKGIPARDALKSLTDIWTYIIGFNTTTQKSDEPIIRGGTGEQNDTRLIWPYQGYWIYMTRSGTFENGAESDNNEKDEVGPVWPQPLR